MTQRTIWMSISKASIISTGGRAAARRRPGSLPACWRLNHTVRAPVRSMARMAASWATMNAPSSSSGQRRVRRSL
jgi:hypothetical protein